MQLTLHSEESHPPTRAGCAACVFASLHPILPLAISSSPSFSIINLFSSATSPSKVDPLSLIGSYLLQIRLCFILCFVSPCLIILSTLSALLLDSGTTSSTRPCRRRQSLKRPRAISGAFLISSTIDPERSRTFAIPLSLSRLCGLLDDQVVHRSQPTFMTKRRPTHL